MIRLVGVLHLLVLVGLAAYVVLLPLLTARSTRGARGTQHPFRALRAGHRPGGAGRGAIRRSAR